MSLGLIVVGQSDRDAIPILIRRLDYTSAIHTRVVRQGNLLNVAKMQNHIAGMSRSHRDLERVLVLMDSEGVDPDVTLDSASPVSNQLNRTFRGFSIHFLAVDHALEGWLACDEDALKSVLGRHARIHISGNPEDHPEPATLMKRIFRANRRSFVKTRDDPLIAQNVKPENILVRSPTFRRLAEVVGAA